MDQAILNTSGDAVRHIFHKAASLLAQLVHFAYAQDAETGRYVDPLLAVFGHKNIHQELWQQHRETFAAWLVLSLEQQHNEMKEYFSAHSDAQPLLHCWIHERLYQKLIPPDASAAEKQLFSIDF